MTRHPRQQILVLAVLLAAAAARGDGGLIRLNESAGPFVVSVFTAPTPLRVGPIDVSVLVQNAVDHAPVLDAEVQVTLRAADIERTTAATHAAATNKLLYAASLDVPEPGRWSLVAEVRAGAHDVAVSCAIDVAPPPPPVVAFWPYLALPGVLIALFAVHQWLKARP